MRYVTVEWSLNPDMFIEFNSEEIQNFWEEKKNFTVIFIANIY